jgi:hypothetical protein
MAFVTDGGAAQMESLIDTREWVELGEETSLRG